MKYVLMFCMMLFSVPAFAGTDSSQPEASVDPVAVATPAAEEKDSTATKLEALEAEQARIQREFETGTQRLNQMKERFTMNAGAIKALRELQEQKKTG